MSNALAGGSGTPSSGVSNPSYRDSSYATVAAGVSRIGTATSPSRVVPNPINVGREGMSSTSRNGPSTAIGNSSGDRRAMSTSGTEHDILVGPEDPGLVRPGRSHREEPPSFFTPSYLRSSRYMQRLRTAYEQHSDGLQDHTTRLNGGKQHSLSTSSSSASLNKMHVPQAHRGVAHTILERQSPLSPKGEFLNPLPSRWSEQDKMNGLEVIADGSEVRFNGITKTSDDEAAAVRSDYPIPNACGIFYFEVTILSRGKDGLIGIGLSTLKAGLNRLPGWETESWAYHGDDGNVFACTASGKAYGPRFAAQDVIGCGVNFRNGNAFFTKNGHYLGIAFTGINSKADTLHPSVGMKKPGEHLRVNFGKTPFVFDIDLMMEQERQRAFGDISKTDVSGLHPPDDEGALIHNLIGQYLAHEGYVETAKAFTSDIHERQTIFKTPARPFQLTNEDDIHAINRQKIRKSILDGDIDRALKYTTAYYPRLIKDTKFYDTYFQLKCRKFIEMMRRYTELGNSRNSPTATTQSPDPLEAKRHNFRPKNGVEEEEDYQDYEDEDREDEEEEEADGMSGTQMELDDQLHRETSESLEPPALDDVDMDASQELSPKLSLMKADQVINLAVAYGQELRAEFGKDHRQLVQNQLMDIFAMLAYPDIAGSPLSHLCDPKGRVKIAEDVNGAILGFLGKPNSAALETLCAQTEALLDLTASKRDHGGAAALISVRDDFLRE